VSSAGASIPGIGLKHRGVAANFLENKGFGWLMEVADEDEFQKPLLYGFIELLIAPEIYENMACEKKKMLQRSTVVQPCTDMNVMRSFL